MINAGILPKVAGNFRGKNTRTVKYIKIWGAPGRVPYYYDLRFDKRAVVTVTLPEHVILTRPFQPLHP